MVDRGIDRARAWEILCEFTRSESLRKHALAVEACVAAYARRFEEDEQKWTITALLHDFDWEIHPQAPDHPMKGEALLAERGVDEEIRRAILSHANYSGVPRISPLEKTLYACDELAGFITAISYVKPHRTALNAPVTRGLRLPRLACAPSPLPGASRRRVSIASASGAAMTTASMCLQNSGSPAAARISARNG
jgi:putative nucleotidyltransferase with HDIG domain